MTLRVLVVGEGPNEVGHEPALVGRRERPRAPGVLETLARKVVADGWGVADTMRWKDIPKFRSGGGHRAEERAILGHVFSAFERGYDALIFSRDSDGHSDRVAAIERALKAAPDLIPGMKRVAGGAAVCQIESWVLAALEVSRTEEMGKKRLEEELSRRGCSLTTKETSALAALVESADLNPLPVDAVSLRLWCGRVRTALCAP